MKTIRLITISAVFALFAAPAVRATAAPLTYGWASVDGLNIFYREGGPKEAATLVLLHGYPASSIQYDKLMSRLASSLHVIAMDYPSFGFSDAPDRTKYHYTFDHVANTVQKFLAAKGVRRFGLYMQDYGVPVGFRLLSATPASISFIVVQNGVIHLDGFPAARDPKGELQSHWQHRNPVIDKRRAAYASSLAYPSPSNWDEDNSVSPEVMLVMRDAVQRPGAVDARNDLWHDYGNNVVRYPEWQSLLRKLQPPTLVIWGSRDEYFTVPGAVAFLRDVPRAEVHVLDTVHFASLEKPDEIADLIRGFLDRNPAVTEAATADHGS